MSVLNPNSDEEPLECPLCMEFLELDDINFYPCSCGYQICRFCWNKIRTEGSGNCPACRSPYSENPADFKPLTREEMAKIKAEKRQKDQAKKLKISENRKHLANVRVVQKNLVFVVGLSPRLSDAEVLRKQEYFGKFGKIHKVVINTSTAYAGNQNQGPSSSAYVTYYRSEDALRAIQMVNNIYIDGRTLKASLGTTKYCSHFMKNQPCPKPDCMYLHELGDEAASFTKEEMQQGKHTDYEKSLHEEMMLNQPPGETTTTTTTNGHSADRTTFDAATDSKKVTNNLNSTKPGQQQPPTPASTPPTTSATAAADTSSSSSGMGSMGNGSSRTPSPKTGSGAGSDSSSNWPNVVRTANGISSFRTDDSPDIVSQFNSSELPQTTNGRQSSKSDVNERTEPPTSNNVVTDSCDQGWGESRRAESRDDLFSEDDLGFDPFHETQKALAEMLESESQQTFGSSQGAHSPALLTAFSTSSQHTSQQQQFPTSSAAPPGLTGLTSSTSSTRAKPPPPGFNMMNFSGLSAVPNLLSPDIHSFGGLDGFPSTNSGSQSNGFGSNQSNGFGSNQSNGFGSNQSNGFGSNHFVNGRDSSDFGYSSSNRLGFGSSRNLSGGGSSQHMDSRSRPDSGGGGGGHLDHHLHQRFRQLAMTENKQCSSSSNNSKDWQDGFRALLPNVNVSFGALPHQNGGQLPPHLLDSVLADRGSSRFNNLQTNTSSSGMLNDMQQSNNHLNNHMDRPIDRSHQHHMQHHQHHHQTLRQNSGWHNIGNNSGVNDWTVMDPAIVGGQLSDNHPQPRAESPPHWIKANLEQLTSDSGSSAANAAASAANGGSFNIGPLLPNAFNYGLSSPPPTSSSSVGLAGWTQPLLANTPPPGFSLNSRTAAQLQQQQFQGNATVGTGSGASGGAASSADLESEFQRLIHSK